jgi:hypothetical protein
MQRWITTKKKAFDYYYYDQNVSIKIIFASTRAESHTKIRLKNRNNCIKNTPDEKSSDEKINNTAGSRSLILKTESKLSPE